MNANRLTLRMRELRSRFRPEFLNRLDHIVLFEPLTRAEVARSIDLVVADVGQRLAGRRLALAVSPEARAWLAERGCDPVCGAWPPRRAIQHELETLIGRALIAGTVEDGSLIVVDAAGGAQQVRFEWPETEAAVAA